MFSLLFIATAATLREKLLSSARAPGKVTKGPTAEAVFKTLSGFSTANKNTIRAAATESVMEADLGGAKLLANAKIVETVAKKAQQALVDRKKAKFAPVTYAVSPKAQMPGQVEVKPSPDMNDPSVFIRPPTDYMMPVQTTTDYVGDHSYEQDVKSLYSEIDVSENKVKGLKLRIVEKENFIDSLIKREDILQEDLRKDKVAVENLHSHVKALKARVERLKKEKQLRQLEAEFHQYAMAAHSLKTQADELGHVKNALYSKMKYMNKAIDPLRRKEVREMRSSIDAEQERHYGNPQKEPRKA